jgi:hypothetical protein
MADLPPPYLSDEEINAAYWRVFQWTLTPDVPLALMRDIGSLLGRLAFYERAIMAPPSDQPELPRA